MRQEMLATYSHKFDSPFTAWLYELSLDGADDEFGGEDFGDTYVMRMGRHVVVCESSGAVYSWRPLRSATADAFWVWASEYFGSDVMAEYMTLPDYEEYVQACEAENLEAFSHQAWLVQGQPVGPLGGAS